MTGRLVAVVKKGREVSKRVGKIVKNGLKVGKRIGRNIPRRGNQAIVGWILGLIFILGLVFAGGVMQGYMQRTAADLNVTIDSGWNNAMSTVSSGAGTITNIYVLAGVLTVLLGVVIGLFARHR